MGDDVAVMNATWALLGVEDVGVAGGGMRRYRVSTLVDCGEGPRIITVEREANPVVVERWRALAEECWPKEPAC